MSYNANGKIRNAIADFSQWYCSGYVSLIQPLSVVFIRI